MAGALEVMLDLPSLASQSSQPGPPAPLPQVSASRGKGTSPRHGQVHAAENKQSSQAGGWFPWRQKEFKLTLKGTGGGPDASLHPEAETSAWLPPLPSVPPANPQHPPQQDMSSRNKTSQPTPRSATPRGASLAANNARGQQAWHSCGCQPAEGCPA